MSARANAFCGQFNIAERFRAARSLASLIERQQAKIESRFDRFRIDLHEGRRCEAKQPQEGINDGRPI
jgi:hypothetical protein